VADIRREGQTENPTASFTKVQRGDARAGIDVSHPAQSQLHLPAALQRTHDPLSDVVRLGSRPQFFLETFPYFVIEKRQCEFNLRVSVLLCQSVQESFG
jgi:hypothetical protein